MTPHLTSEQQHRPKPAPGARRVLHVSWVLVFSFLFVGSGCFPRLNGRRTFGNLELPEPDSADSTLLADDTPPETRRTNRRGGFGSRIELVAAKPTIRSQDSALMRGWAGLDNPNPSDSSPKTGSSSKTGPDAPPQPDTQDEEANRNAGGSRIQLQTPIPQLGAHSIGPTRPRLLQPQPIVDEQPEITPAGSFFNSSAQHNESRLRLRTPERLNSPGIVAAPVSDSSVPEVPEAIGAQLGSPNSVESQQSPSPQPSVDPSAGEFAGALGDLSEVPAEQIPGEIPPGVPGPEALEPSRERTVLDRLRGLYPSRLEESSTELLRKNLSRLQTPWNRRTPPPEIEVPQPEQQSAVTADVSAGPSVPELPSNAVAGNPSGINESSQQILQRLIAQIESDLNAWPFDENGQPLDEHAWRRTQTDLRLLYLISNRNADAVSAIAALSPDEQEFWQSLMLGLSHYRSESDSAADPNEKLMATSEQLKAALQHLQAMAPLTIRKLTFASRIHGFGSLETFPSAEFNPGQPVLIYAEVDHFRSELSSTGAYRSEFMAVVEMLRIDPDDPTEHVVESIRVPSIVDETQSRRTDYFQSYELVIPSHLTSGRYQIRLRLRDQTSGQQAESTIEFTVR